MAAVAAHTSGNATEAKLWLQLSKDLDKKVRAPDAYPFSFHMHMPTHTQASSSRSFVPLRTVAWAGLRRWPPWCWSCIS